MKSFILLENMEFHATHGVFEQENIVGNTFIVNLKIEVNIAINDIEDNIGHTVSYAEIFDIVKREMAIQSKLLEHVAARIVKQIKDFSPMVKEVELKISKQNPPVDGQVEYASVILID